MGQHRVAVTWAVLGGLLLALFAGTVLILNATLYSASGFAGSYLAALSRHDVAAAVELAGPPSASGGAKAGRDLLDPRARPPSGWSATVCGWACSRTGASPRVRSARSPSHPATTPALRRTVCN